MRFLLLLLVVVIFLRFMYAELDLGSGGLFVFTLDQPGHKCLHEVLFDVNSCIAGRVFENAPNFDPVLVRLLKAITGLVKKAYAAEQLVLRELLGYDVEH